MAAHHGEDRLPSTAAQINQQQAAQVQASGADRCARLQALIGQLLGGELRGKRRIDSVRLLRRLVGQLEYRLGWSTQLDLFEALEGLLREERDNIEESDWRLAYDVTQLIAECTGRLQFRLERRQLTRLFGCVVENLGHRRSEVRRASLLLISACLQDASNDFQLLLQLLIEHGLGNQRDQEAQRGAILSLPLLMSEQVCQGEDLLPLIRCLANLLVDSTHTQLFYSLHLALQRLAQTLGEPAFSQYLRQCDPEAVHLYRQTMSRSGSLATQPGGGAPVVEPAPANKQPEPADGQAASTSPRQVTFEDNDAAYLSTSPEASCAAAGAADEDDEDAASSLGSASGSTQVERAPEVGPQQDASAHQEPVKPAAAELRRSQQQQQVVSVSSACSSEAPLVDPASYMAASALNGRPLDHLQRLRHELHPEVATNTDEPEEWLAIDDLCVSCTPTTELQPHRELKFGIFPRHLVRGALETRSQVRFRLEALEEMMRIVRDSPVNHLAILMTYFDSFLDQLLARLLTPDTQQHQQQQQPQVSHESLELVALDMIESVVIKTKVSTLHFVRPLVGLLVRALARTRWPQVRHNIGRCLHKMMAYLPPQHVIDALFEHKHSKSGFVRELAIQRVTGGVLEFGRQEFNLTKLCYHVLPMLADQQPQVRLAALECIAALARALGPDRIGSLLTAAEAVQTGCELEGLLDAIYTRLQRRALPRCLPDGSIQQVLRMATVRAYRGSPAALAADLRWVLEAPARHHHHQQQQHLKEATKKTSTPVIDLKPPQAVEPAPGHYSPMDSETAVQERRHSIAFNLQPVDVSAAIKESHSDSSAPPTPTPPPQQQQSQQPPEVANGSQVGGEQRQWSNGPAHQRPHLQPIRYSSQESLSSGDTNKVLFQYYLGKFRQSLTGAESQLGGASSGLPSDSLIYTTDTQQAYELARHRSRQQQTSFDYEPHSVGRVPPATSGAAGAPLGDGEEARAYAGPKVKAQQVVEERAPMEAEEEEAAAPEVEPVEKQRPQKPAPLVRQAASQEPPAGAGAEPAPIEQPPAPPEQAVEPVRDAAAPTPRDATRRRRLESLASRASSSSSRELSDQATQTTPLPELASPEHRRRNRRASSRRRRPTGSHESPADAAATGEPSQEEERQERPKEEELQQQQQQQVRRRRESRSQPPGARIIQVDRNRCSDLVGAGLCQDSRRSVSVSPSLAASANVRHLLETVAQVEGPFQEPQLAYRVASEALQSPCWSTKVEGILALVRLTSHHPSLLLQEAHLHETVLRLALETRNLRSTVARAAIFALGDLCSKLGRALEPQADTVVRALMQRSSDSTAFIREDIRRALVSMVESLTNWRLANLLIVHGSGHKNALVRRMAAHFLAQLVERMGPARCLVGSRDIGAQLLPAAANLAQDSNPQARYFGRLMLARLMQHSAFDRLLRKHLVPNLYRSTFGVVESVRRRGPGEAPVEPI